MATSWQNSIEAPQAPALKEKYLAREDPAKLDKMMSRMTNRKIMINVTSNKGKGREMQSELALMEC